MFNLVYHAPCHRWCSMMHWFKVLASSASLYIWPVASKFESVHCHPCLLGPWASLFPRFALCSPITFTFTSLTACVHSDVSGEDMLAQRPAPATTQGSYHHTSSPQSNTRYIFWLRIKTVTNLFAARSMTLLTFTTDTIVKTYLSSRERH